MIVTSFTLCPSFLGLVWFASLGCQITLPTNKYIWKPSFALKSTPDPEIVQGTGIRLNMSYKFPKSSGAKREITVRNIVEGYKLEEEKAIVYPNSANGCRKMVSLLSVGQYKSK